MISKWLTTSLLPENVQRPRRVAIPEPEPMCQVVVDKKVSKICIIIDRLSNTNPVLHRVLNQKQRKLGTIKVEIMHAVHG